jgi:hypothetical protein
MQLNGPMANSPYLLHNVREVGRRGKDAPAGKICNILRGRAGESDLTRLVSPIGAVEMIPTEDRQTFEHAGGTADREIALLTQGYGMSRVLRPI